MQKYEIILEWGILVMIKKREMIWMFFCQELDNVELVSKVSNICFFKENSYGVYFYYY